MLIVPFADMSSDALRNVIEDWLSRQAQEHLALEGTLSEMVERVVDKLKREELFVSWDDESQTINIIDQHQIELIKSKPETFGDLS